MGRKRLVVISGPSGVGKSTLVVRLRSDPRVYWSVSATTRAPRGGERDGVDYHFLTPEAFEARVRAEEFLEHAWVHDHRYGTLREPLERAIDRGQVPLLDLDIQGALVVMDQGLGAYSVFILPPSFEDLEARLTARRTETPERLAKRLENARRELAFAPRYDARVVNDDLERALAELVRLIEEHIGVRLAVGGRAGAAP